jgi:hypothetical protein
MNKSGLNKKKKHQDSGSLINHTKSLCICHIILQGCCIRYPRTFSTAIISASHVIILVSIPQCFYIMQIIISNITVWILGTCNSILFNFLINKQPTFMFQHFKALPSPFRNDEHVQRNGLWYKPYTSALICVKESWTVSQNSRKWKKQLLIIIKLLIRDNCKTGSYNQNGDDHFQVILSSPQKCTNDSHETAVAIIWWSGDDSNSRFL